MADEEDDPYHPHGVRDRHLALLDKQSIVILQKYSINGLFK
jgi:hypothetical protein